MAVDNFTPLTLGRNDRFSIPSVLSVVKEDRICLFSNEQLDRINLRSGDNSTA
jgi:hypothetical protein